jgi:hypothetical protein
VKTYADFSIETLASVLGIEVRLGRLFPGLVPSEVPGWLSEAMVRGSRQAMVSEKARSEFIVAPILMACQELSPGPIAIYSGQRLDVDLERGLVGECDFILSATEPLPALRAPLVMVVEAKKNDVEGGIWQCLAQMAGARLFNEKNGRKGSPIFGCVINAEAWQFLKLEGLEATIDQKRYYIDNLASILAVFGTMLESGAMAVTA